MLTGPDLTKLALSTLNAHLARFTRRDVAKQYLAVIERTTLGKERA